MKQNRYKDSLARAEEYFERFYRLGFFGAKDMVLADIARAVGYKGSHQGFHKFFQRWREKYTQEEITAQIKEIKAELKQMEENQNGQV